MLCAYITNPACRLHEMGADHPECPDRIGAIEDRLRADGLLDFMVPHDAPQATRAQLERVHASLYLSELEASSPASGYRHVDPDTSMNAHTLAAARGAAGAAVLAAELVARGEASSAFCNVRPAGHHATRSAAMGFCFFNNVAVGIANALEALGMERVALVDFDAHHGNGSEDIFAGDERVLMVSTFETGLYPFNGDTPTGPNLCNVPLPAYSRGDRLRAAVDEHWLPALDAFRPQMIFVSAGFDAHREDDMSHLMWDDGDYLWVTQRIDEVARRHAQGRIVSVLEGGYALRALARSAAAHVRVLVGAD